MNKKFKQHEKLSNKQDFPIRHRQRNYAAEQNYTDNITRRCNDIYWRRRNTSAWSALLRESVRQWKHAHTTLSVPDYWITNPSK